MAGGGGGKSDMERIGLFSEMGYTTIGDKYPKVHLTSCKYCNSHICLYMQLQSHVFLPSCFGQETAK